MYTANLKVIHDKNSILDLQIPGGYASGTIATTMATTLTSDGIERICGRTFTTSTTDTLAIAYSSTGSNSICSKCKIHTPPCNNESSLY